MQSNTGIDLVESMAKWDLRGDVTYSNLPEGGACVAVTFPLDEEAAYAQEQGERWKPVR